MRRSRAIIIAKVKKALLSMQRASWEQGLAAQAFLESGEPEMAYLMAREAGLRQAEDGRLSVLCSDKGSTDPGPSGEIVFRMAESTGDSELLEAHEKMLDHFLHSAPRAIDGTLYHILDAREMWIDSMYMAPPYLAAAKYYDESLRQVEGLHRRLWSTESQLYFHKWDEESRNVPYKSFWGVGNGWAAAGLCRTIDMWPQTRDKTRERQRDRLISLAAGAISGCLEHRRPDGLFHNIVNEPDTFVETNLAQMLACSIFRGIHSGWLTSDYLKDAVVMRDAVISKVDENGFVDGVCGAPLFDRPGRAAEGQAFFLMMESAYNHLTDIQQR